MWRATEKPLTLYRRVNANGRFGPGDSGRGQGSGVGAQDFVPAYMVSFGDIDSFPIFESRETSRFRLIGSVGNPPIVNEHIARGFRLGDSFDLTCRRAVKLGPILQVSEPPRWSVVQNLVQFLVHYLLRDRLFIRCLQDGFEVNLLSTQTLWVSRQPATQQIEEKILEGRDELLKRLP